MLKKIRASITEQVIENCAWSLLAVGIVTAILWAIGRPVLGEAVIALLYLLPIGWAAARWGQIPGILAAVAAALAFDFFFIPPFYTFNVGSLEEWLVLVIFLAVAVLIVGRIQSGFARAQAREREAIFMYELSVALAGTRDRQAIARTLADRLQQLYQAELVEVALQSDGQLPPVVARAPADNSMKARPDLILPIMAAREIIGEIRVWAGGIPLPPVDDRLLQSFANQGASALERGRLVQAEIRVRGIELNAAQTT
jgi:K+-sensing histidine kinase KdpD